MQTLKMSRESRKLFQELNNIANADNVQGLIIPGHIYICDRLTIEYYTAPMVNIIKSRLKSVSKAKREWKHYTVEYWESVLRSMLSHNVSAKRSATVLGVENLESFTYIISQFLLTDYSNADAILINDIVNKYTHKEIFNACNSAKQMNVYEPRYISAILEKEDSKKQLAINNINRLTTKIESSDIKLDRTVQVHSIMEIATAEYEYQKKLENDELERRFMEMIGNNDKK